MRITLIATLQEYWGGSEVLWVEVAELAIKKGYQVQVVVYSQKKGLHPTLQRLKGRVSFVEMPNIVSPVGKLAKVYQSLKTKAFPCTLTEVTTFQPDCIIVNQVNSYSAAFHPVINTFLLECKKPFFLITHFNYDHDVLQYRDIVKARENFSKATTIFFVSHRNCAMAEKQLAMKLPNADIIGNHPSVRNLNYVDYPKNYNNVQFAAVARLNAKFKGQNILLEILSQERWQNRQWHLNFYGSGPDELYLKDLTLFYRLSDKVTFHGHESNISSIWANNHALLLPSIAEGKPLALIEAMMCGRIAIASDVAGITELIDDKINGFIATSYFPKPFDEAMEKAWQSKDQWQEMGRLANTRIANSIDFNPHETLLKKIKLTVEC